MTVQCKKKNRMVLLSRVQAVQTDGTIIQQCIGTAFSVVILPIM